jgi:excisionase family DNA binding protein
MAPARDKRGRKRDAIGGQIEQLWEGRHTFSVDEAARILGVSRASAYTAIKNRELPAIRIGKRLVIPRRSIERLLEGAQ